MKTKHFAMAVLLAAIWGFNFVVIKFGLKDLPPLTFCVLRMFLVSVPGILFIKPPRVAAKLVLIYGLLVFALQFAFLFLGIYLGVTSWLASLLFQVNVFFSMILAVIFLREKIQKLQILGGIIAFLGIGLIAINIGGEVSLSGVFAIITAAISCAFGNLIAKKFKAIDIFALIIWAGFAALPMLVMAAWYFEGSSSLIYSVTNWNLNATLAIAYTVAIATYMGFYIWNVLLIHYPLSTVTPFALLIPIFSMIFSILLFDEDLYLWKIVATGLVILGLAINIFSARQKVLATA